MRTPALKPLTLNFKVKIFNCIGLVEYSIISNQDYLTYIKFIFMIQVDIEDMV